ncbi:MULTISPECIES: hypothetical protein [Streptomyces]|uniref:hypothetical protein n=1 Tax=Streptomyces TaxID=1883 RepID=UPI00186B17C0|nr:MULTISPECIES: hypothetical protein [Streptomyces]
MTAPTQPAPTQPAPTALAPPLPDLDPAPDPAGSAELSCYTTSLVAALAGRVPDPGLRLAHAVRLAVRTDLPDGQLAFRHHARIDRAADGHRLRPRSAPDWPATVAGLTAALAAGPVIAVGNTRTLRWSPSFGGGVTSHWLVVEERSADRWRVSDDFAALLPDGEQLPFAGWLDDAELRAALTPTGPLPPEIARRDRYALGEPVDQPPATDHRWLAWEPAGPPEPEPAPDGDWLEGTLPALAFVAGRFAEDPTALRRHADDLWAAARHHRHRLAALTRAGLIHREPAERAADAWAELPRALRFAIASAERGRPRPALVGRAFDAVIDSTSRMSRAVSQAPSGAMSPAMSQEKSQEQSRVPTEETEES